ncbi:MAG: DNA polymerase III subunit alpha [Anaerolineae bacterium]|nr:DNA polymerase III subunit alpha [Anaerolineae bacterium]
MGEFVHLHVHSYYSLLDGLSSPRALARQAAKLGMPALALTDHGVLYGAVEFYRAAEKVRVKPIIGIEAYVAQRSMHDRSTVEDRRLYHLVLLAQNQAGYRNLLQLASTAMLEGFYYKPRIDKETLAQHSDGLIATSACGSGEIARLIRQERVDEARGVVAWYREVFPGRFFLEIQEHDIPELEPVNRQLIAFSREFDLPLIATNDVHYARRDQADAHDVLLAIGTGKSLHDPDRMRMEGQTFYMRSAEEMAALFSHVPEALTNTVRVAEMCNVKLEFGNYHLPLFDVPEGETPASYLRALCEQGLRRRYGDRAETAAVRQRLEHELRIIHQMGFDAYFLIVWDLCRAAQERDIWYNARGSAAGSIVAYSLGITMVDPLANGLIFERFLNPGRVTMPDIDLDFPDDRRGEMIQYTVHKYGKENVAQIITFGTLGARAAVRDVGRVMDIPLAEVDRIAKMIPNLPGKPVAIAEALDQVPELQELYNTTPYARTLLDTAVQLEGVARHASTHAAGVVIADAPLVEYCPLNRPTKGDVEGKESAEAVLNAVTQWAMEDVDAIGLLKVDFLGLSALSIMRHACELIEQRHDIHFDLDTIPLDDPQVYRLLSSGDVAGVFQVEGAGFRRVLREMQPSRYEHIVAVLALYRPGPMEHIPSYIKRMHGQETVEHRHPALAPILDETFGIVVFQEQIIQIASQLAGYEPGEADTIRKAVGKKIKEALLAHREKFVQGAVENDIPQETASAIFDDIEYFARYGFNKCLPGDVEVIDSTTGRLVRIQDIAKGYTPLQTTLTCDLNTLQLSDGQVSAVMNNGRKPVFRLTTALGRTIEATSNHPFLAYEGWRLLAELETGDLIAVPRRIPVEGRTEWPEHHVIVLGHLLAEGNLCHPSSVYFYSSDDAQVTDYVRAAERFPNVQCTVSQHKGTFSVYAKRLHRGEPPGVVLWAQELGIWNKCAREKEIPAAVFELTNRQLGLLISRMWEGDGHINLDGRSLYYATASERMARQLQHLLLRLGIISRLRTVEFPYKDGRKGYQLFITGDGNFIAFYHQIAVYFVNKKRRDTVQTLCLAEPTSMGTKDIVPIGVKALVRQAKQRAGTTWTQVHHDCGVATREFYPNHNNGKKGYTRHTIQQLADYFDDPALRRYAESDVYWDRVVDIAYVGDKATYDIQVPGTHNFIANDILVHNSHAADYAVLTCQTAYLKAHYPVEYMTALCTVERNNTEKVGAIIGECRRMDIEVLPPSVNHSLLNFAIEDRPEGPAIRFGLGAVKNVGDGAVEEIIHARGDRPFHDLGDFCRRVDMRAVNRRALECLIRAGALSDFGPRAQLLAALDRMMDLSARIHRAKEVGQMSLFGEATGVQLEDRDGLLVGLPAESEASQRELLEWEKELIGAYLFEHPLVEALQELEDVITGYAGQLQEEQSGQAVTTVGMVHRVRRHVAKNGKEMAFVTLEDLYGTCDVVVFPDIWAESKDMWLPDQVLVIGGKVNVRQEQTSLICSWVKKPQDVTRPRGAKRSARAKKAAQPAPPSAPPSSSRVLQVTIRRSGDMKRDLDMLSAAHELLLCYPGRDRFTFLLQNSPNGDQVLEFPNHSTGYCRELGQKLVDLLGPGTVEVREERWA